MRLGWDLIDFLGTLLDAGFRRARHGRVHLRWGSVPGGTGSLSPSPTKGTCCFIPDSIPVLIPEAVIAVKSLILQALIGNGILKKNAGLFIWLAIVIAVLAPVDGALALIDRRISAHIVDSRIYGRRPKVFGHIQRMPLAFFTRIQTDALVSSRHNNDVMGGHKAFTEVLSMGVSGLWRKGFGESDNGGGATLACRPMTGQSTWSSSMAGRFFTGLTSLATLPFPLPWVALGPAFLVVLRLHLVRGLLFVPVVVVRVRVSFRRPVQHGAHNRSVDLIEHLD